MSNEQRDSNNITGDKEARHLAAIKLMLEPDDHHQP